MTKIAIIGSGNVGATLGKRLSELSHEICYGVREPNDAKHLSLKEYAHVEQNKTAVAQSDIIFLATPWRNTAPLVSSLSDVLKEKIVVDCTNPLKADLSGLEVCGEDSGAQTLAKLAPSAIFVKAFNTTGYNIMADPVIAGVPTAMFIASDDDYARELVCSLAESLNFNAIAFGGLVNARLLEPLALTWISMAYKLGMGRDFGLAVLRKNAEA